MFKIGDKVRCVSACPHDSLYAGDEFVVHNYQGGNPSRLQQMVSFADRPDYYFYSFRFELVKDEKPFKDGDKVNFVNDNKIVDETVYTIKVTNDSRSRDGFYATWNKNKSDGKVFYRWKDANYFRLISETTNEPIIENMKVALKKAYDDGFAAGKADKIVDYNKGFDAGAKYMRDKMIKALNL